MSDFSSLIFYVGLFAASVLLVAYGSNRNYKLFTFLGLFIPILIGGLRYNVGTDYFNYVGIYNASSQASISQFISNNAHHIELGFFGLVKLSEIFTHNYYLMFGISSAITIVFFYLGLQRFNPRHKSLVYFMYLLLIYPVTLNAVRQGIAMSICFYAFSFLIERKPRKYIFWFLVASLFHTSALLLMPLYFLNVLIRNDKKTSGFQTLIRLVALSLVLLLVIPKMFESLSHFSLFAKYTDYETVSQSVNNYTFYLNAAIAGIILLFYRYLILLDRKNIYYIAFAIIDLVLSVIGFSSPALSRINLYLAFFNIILLTEFIDVFQDWYGRFAMRTLNVSYGVFYFVVAYYFLGLANLVPYQFINGKF